ncbi:MAG: NAD(P)/FAD-dependent oxidoreductase, partial [Actinobacteria bacterium]|nr:NAD(P)/FAD-dependent oxidoreductase [Actinomycetota bacterium]
EAKNPVERIVVEDGRVKGVYVKGGLIESPVVISNAGIKETTYVLVGKDYFEKEFIGYLENLKYGYGGISLKYALDKPFTNLHFGFKIPNNFKRNMRDALDGKLPEELSIMLVGTSTMDPRLAPPGKQMLLAISPGPVAEPGDTDWDPWVQSMRRQIEQELFPGISKHIIFCEATTPDIVAKQNSRFLGDAIGVAQSIDQVGENTPPCISPVKGLYYVGADVGSKGIASEMATQSAIDLFDQLDSRRLLPAEGSLKYKIACLL